MRKTVRRILCSFLCLSLLIGSLSFGSAALTADDAWRTYYDEYMQTGSGLYMAPGSDESERNFSWYAPADAGECRVIVSDREDFSGARTFTGTSVKTPEGDLRCKVTVRELWPDRTYWYKCADDKWESEPASFTTLSGSDFTAMYTTDIHVSAHEDDDPDSLVNQSYTFSEVLNAAADKGGLDLVISAGDQASAGARREYTSLAAAPALSSVPFAFCAGNHDRKGIAYKYFTNNPNEYTRALVHAFISYDYYYVKGDVLFFVFDSNVGSMTAHRNFVRDAIRKHPDVKWRVATFHHDLYGGRIPRREDENKILRLIWAPMFDEFRFDLVLLGHSHYYTMSNAVFRNKTSQDLTGLDSVTDPKGTIVMVSGSINHPRSMSDGEEEPPVGENIAYSYLTGEPIYNLLDFSEDAIAVRSYTLGAQEPFHTFTIAKTDAMGGHPKNGVRAYDFLIRMLSDIYGAINEVWTSARMRLNWKDFVGK
jgi:predicted phosphodiesterase